MAFDRPRTLVRSCWRTRPEAINFGARILALGGRPATRWLLTGQPREMVSQVNGAFGLCPTATGLMSRAKTLTTYLAPCRGCGEELAETVRTGLVQGDTQHGLPPQPSPPSTSRSPLACGGGARAPQPARPFPKRPPPPDSHSWGQLPFRPHAFPRPTSGSGVVGRTPGTGNTVIDALLRKWPKPPPSWKLPGLKRHEQRVIPGHRAPSRNWASARSIGGAIWSLLGSSPGHTALLRRAPQSHRARTPRGPAGPPPRASRTEPLGLRAVARIRAPPTPVCFTFRGLQEGRPLPPGTQPVLGAAPHHREALRPVSAGTASLNRPWILRRSCGGELRWMMPAPKCSHGPARNPSATAGQRQQITGAIREFSG